MKRRMRETLFAVLLVIALVLAGKYLYRHFVTDQIMDQGGMENPYAQININQED